MSYFLGMTQAKISCEMLLGVPHLVHLDAVLALLGQSTNRSRPDFIGKSLSTTNYTIAVEAKGRTSGRTAAVIDSAKHQAGQISSVIGTSSSVCVASVASFDPDGHWEAYLEDPPSTGTGGSNTPSVGMLLLAYYRPMVAALLTAGVNDSDESTTFTHLVGMDLSFGLPTDVVNLLRGVPATGPVSPDQRQAVEAGLEGVSADQAGRQEMGGGATTWQSRGEREAQVPTECTGFDGVEVRLGPSWFPG